MSSAQSIASRRRAGKVSHIGVRELWAQHRVANTDSVVIKVKGENNVADILARHVTGISWLIISRVQGL